MILSDITAINQDDEQPNEAEDCLLPMYELDTMHMYNPCRAEIIRCY